MSFRQQPPLMGQPPLPMMAAPFGGTFAVPVPGLPANMPMPPLPVGSLPPPPVMPGLLPTQVLRPTIQPLLPNSSHGTSQGSTANSHSTNNSSGKSYHHHRNEKRNQERSEQSGKSTTVFVGNITERASDALVRQILMKCGYIANWKRVQGATGRLQAFGFCEYASPDSALRSMRLLSDFPLGEKKLLVKVDSKTRTELDDYKQKKKDEKQKEKEDLDDDYDVEKDPETKAVDDTSVEEINRLVQDNSDVLSGKYEDSLPYMKKSHSGCSENLEGLDMDNAKKNLVSKEIRSFREAYRNEDKEKKDKDKERDRDSRRDRGRDRHADKDNERHTDRRREKDRRRNDGDNDNDHNKRSTSRDPSAVSDRSSKRPKDEEKERPREKERAASDDEDDYEQRRLERKRREKDQNFLERLKEWEARERKRSRDYEKQYMKDDKKKNEQIEERQHLAEFLEDYEDDRDDPKYYRGSAFARRYRDREMEKEGDARDRQREMEEIEDVLRKQALEPPVNQENITPNIPSNHVVSNIVKQEPSPAPQSITTKFQAALVPTFPVVKDEAASPSPVVPVTIAAASSSPMHQQTDSMASFDSARSSPAMPSHNAVSQSSHVKREQESEDEAASSPATNNDNGAKKTFGFGMKLQQLPQQGSSKKLESVFNANDDEAKNETAPKRKLTRLDEEDGHQQDGSSDAAGEDKKKVIRELIEKIPTGKDELFAYELKWEMVDQSLIDRRIKPWVNKKIFQYIGEEEQTLVEFVCSKVLTKCVPKNILEDVSMVLDDEAEVFVVKMWRLLIYETEAKSLGIVK